MGQKIEVEETVNTIFILAQQFVAPVKVAPVARSMPVFFFFFRKKNAKSWIYATSAP